MIADWSEPIDPQVDGMGGLPAFLTPNLVSSVVSPFATAIAGKVVGKSPDVKAQEKMMTQQMKLEAARMASAQVRQQATVLWVIGGVAVAIAGVFVIAALWGRKKKSVVKNG